MSKGTKNKKWRIKWSAEKVMSISALFVSAISLFALFHQLNLAREENELIRKQQSASVLPYLDQWFSNLDGFKMTFGNVGVGPAFIKTVKFELNDSLLFNNSDHLFNKVRQALPELKNHPISTSTFKSGKVIPAGEAIHILNLKSAEAENLFKEFLKKNKVIYEIIYADVYGEKWILSNRNGNNIPILLSKEN